jgi:RNA polymerase sigma-70 factor (ECF subfamily)
LLERIRDAADAPSWDEFWNRYWPLVFRFAKRRGCSDVTAQDVVQDVMIEVFKGRELFHYDPTKGRFRDWLGGVVRNVVSTRRQRPAERVRGVGGSAEHGLAEFADPRDPTDDDWKDLFDDAVLAALLDVVRREVSPATYQAFELLAIQGLSGSDVARLTGLSRNAAYLARKRVLARLRELGESYREEGRLLERVKRALVSRPCTDVERTMTSLKEDTLRRREERAS